MRRLILLLSALLLLAAPAALAQSAFPEKIALPDGFAPEGIAIAGGKRSTLAPFHNRRDLCGDLRTGAGGPRAGRHGPEHARRDRVRVRHWHGCGSRARIRHARVYNARTGELLSELPARERRPGTFINDVVVTKEAAFFTDSQRPVLYRVALSKNGAPGAVPTIPLRGEYQHVAGQFNLNGIVATTNGKTLIAVQSSARKLFPINPYDRRGEDDRHRQRTTSRTATASSCRGRRSTSSRTGQQDRGLPAGLRPDEGQLVRAITDRDFDVPTTIDRAGERLYVVNARFGTTTPEDQSYHVVRVR